MSYGPPFISFIIWTISFWLALMVPNYLGLPRTVSKIGRQGLQIAPDKIQLQDPYFYLGFELCHQKIGTQKLQLQVGHLKTLNDFQRLLGDINWIRP